MGLCWGKLKQRDHLEAVHGRMVLKWEDVDWYHLAQDRDPEI